ncbi:MAG: superoxide dismutase [Planctomycetota bacterium]|nr:superoxide dismutase [Planctomycetota bacterium]
MSFKLPDLPYAYDALEPHIDARTMEIHHTKHHNGYVQKANAALEGTKFASMTPEEVVQHLNDLPADKKTAVRNNAGGHVNHSLFWTIMAPPKAGGGGEPKGDLGALINSTFKSFNDFKSRFADAAANRFGSGWAWLCVTSPGKIEVCSTANQDNPLMKSAIGDAAGCGGTPILGLDVWEHAYYLNYQNKRPDYINAFWNVVNWEQVGKNYAQAQKK